MGGVAGHFGSSNNGLRTAVQSFANVCRGGARLASDPVAWRFGDICRYGPCSRHGGTAREFLARRLFLRRDFGPRTLRRNRWGRLAKSFVGFAGVLGCNDRVPSRG